ncbi:hypothetical protein Poly21_44900 [Allorhodopirellula heiligendammensis]|uniref:Uncharacterized protein n=2 Tax=Allorhodopirellula heiligendammensis TaxID=2714739 RepID=A0A5C6BEI5_9BACT|nr:hypothetical protein Poly21_44900 [Allorhodopirellula heiligendammensis]
MLDRCIELALPFSPPIRSTTPPIFRATSHRHIPDHSINMHGIEQKRRNPASFGSRLWGGALVVLSMLVLIPATRSVQAQDASDVNAPSDPLVAKQSSVATRYARLEELLLRLADVESRENPERAALLKRVARQSRERFVLEKMRGASTLIASGQLSKALEDQKAATGELESLLKLLLSEDRSSRIRDEKKRIAEMIKQLRLTERNERSVRARTENGVELEEVLKEQQEISKRAEALSEEFREDDPEESGAPKEPREPGAPQDSTESKPPSDSAKSTGQEEGADQQESTQTKDNSEPPGDENASDDQDTSEQESSEADSSEQGKPQDSGDPSQSSPQSQETPEQGDQSESAPSGSPQQPTSPEQDAQDQLEKAITRMQQAQEKLAQKNRGAATEEQRQAEEELRKAIDKLEKILRQLREEEIQRELAKLEARLRKMAAMQSAVLDETQQLAQTPQSQRDRATDLKSGDLAFEEQKITLEADRAMLLLREEGSSVAFPEVIQQLRDDTKRVTTRLGQSKIDEVTQGIQSDILAALEEMIAALAKAQRDNEKKQQQEQQQGQPGSQGSEEEPLVQALAELKLLRTMQTRIHGTTDRYGDLLQENEAGGDSSTGEDVLPLLRELAQRQDRLYQITRDLVTKRNQ